MGIKIKEVSYVRFSAPDLDELEAFLIDFGMIRAERTSGVLYMRGFESDSFLYVAHRGEPRFGAAGFEAASIEDLQILAREEKVSIQSLDDPGGRRGLQLTDPSGFRIEVVAARKAAARIEVPRPAATNDTYIGPRRSALKRLAKVPSHVKRLGHFVLNVKNVRQSESWYKSRLGLITSDEINLGSPERVLGAFLRCDRGSMLSDHHTVVLLSTGKSGFNHAGFEVTDIDDLMCGHDLLKQKVHHHVWGVGRHLLGSQIFDCWLDPWGHILEHCTAGDLLNAACGSHTSSIQEITTKQWGPMRPPQFLKAADPLQVEINMIGPSETTEAPRRGRLEKASGGNASDATRA